MITDFIQRSADGQFVLECSHCQRDRKRRLERESENMLLIAANYQGWRVIGSALHCGKCSSKISMEASFSNKFKQGE